MRDLRRAKTRAYACNTCKSITVFVPSMWGAGQEVAGHPGNGLLNQVMHLAAGAGFAPAKHVPGHHKLGQSANMQIRLEAFSE